MVDLNKDLGEECKAQLDAEFGEGNCRFIECDVANGDALRGTFQNTVDQFGRLDIVINNAGITNEKDWEKTIQVNLTSVIKGTYLALEHMSKEYGKQGGTIINVSSMAGNTHTDTHVQKHELLKQQTAMMFLFRDVKVRQRLHDSRVHKATAASDCASPESLLLRRAASSSEKEAPPLITLQNQLTNVPSANATISFFFLFISKGRGQRVKGHRKLSSV
uniref:15-hydroxyprostaglandin dehydrogenase n=2 Tax=Neolamprologus brichardi TaxID=32507 RepID=A0A3Q4N9A2_NEOBR